MRVAVSVERSRRMAELGVRVLVAKRPSWRDVDVLAEDLGEGVWWVAG